jgi:hypothetical protein
MEGHYNAAAHRIGIKRKGWARLPLRAVVLREKDSTTPRFDPVRLAETQPLRCMFNHVRSVSVHRGGIADLFESFFLYGLWRDHAIDCGVL